ncbi:MAG: NmrA family NAD(P)-binding protein [Deltaproteobacteria bacterium]|nr:NmrA family NAD(P)-binding protein [Deltaproteobacteria bacterium]MBW2695220.1 NmrA family NAD(P)-binding protein [Deltaproteobacteria bacterium]
MSEAPLRVVVAGATGYLGKFVALEFKRRGHQVRVLTRSRERRVEQLVVTPGHPLTPLLLRPPRGPA